jgi:hypothetical protein
MVKLSANMHGDEIVGREVLLHHIQYLLCGYSRDPEIAVMLDRTILVIIPTLNPGTGTRGTEGWRVGTLSG